MKKYTLQICFIVLAVLFMAIGYASVNSVSLDIDADVSAILQDVVFITDVEYVPNDIELLGEEVKIKSVNSLKKNRHRNASANIPNDIKAKYV